MRCANPFPTLDAYASAVPTLDGKSVDSGEVVFDRDTYHFRWRNTDVTNLISQNEKAKNFSGFDRAKDNLRAYNESVLAKTGKMPSATGSTSFLGNLFSQLSNDPLGAPLDALDKGVSRVGQSSGIQAVAAVGAVIALVLIFKQFK